MTARRLSQRIALMGIVGLASLVTPVPAQTRASTNPGFEVHEWGTFTEVLGSNGVAIPWWALQHQGPAELPEFVQLNPRTAKLGRTFTTRMETPVLYFYPGEPMSVKVSAEFKSGFITEWYPSAGFQPIHDPTEPPSPIQWDIDLIPPHSDRGRLIPAVSKRGRHYAHARNVPDAWLVEGSNAGVEQAPQVEKFIFYRGAGEASLPLIVTNDSNGVITIHERSSCQIDEAWLIHVADQKLSWSKVSNLIGHTDTEREPKSIAIPEPLDSIKSAQPALEAELGITLTQSGLTQPEAAAMIATWREAWLGEQGLRLLYIVPRGWVDQNLPISIEPQPIRMQRVFVARSELITPAQEERLVAILNEPFFVEDEQVTAAGKVGLGRFLAAGFERAVQIHADELRSRAVHIQQTLLE